MRMQGTYQVAPEYRCHFSYKSLAYNLVSGCGNSYMPNSYKKMASIIWCYAGWTSQAESKKSLWVNLRQVSRSLLMKNDM